MKKVVGILLIVVFFCVGIWSDKVGVGVGTTRELSLPTALFMGFLCFLVGIYFLIDELEARNTNDELEARNTNDELEARNTNDELEARNTK